MSIRIDVAVCNDKGRVRGNNEDNFYINGIYMQRDFINKGGLFRLHVRDELQVFAVCDGMGGTEAGEEAALSLVSALQSLQYKGDDAFNPKVVTDFLQSASDRVYNESCVRGSKSGATVALLLIRDGFARLVHVGDSRIYRLRDGALTQMTEDHSEVQRMLSMGAIQPEEVRKHPKRHVITQYVGMPPTEVMLSPSISDPLPMKKGDVFLLCSDGLTDMVEDQHIREILISTKDAAEASKHLVQEALKSGGNDNVTAMCARVTSVRPSTKLHGLRLYAALIAALICANAVALAALAVGWL